MATEISLRDFQSKQLNSECLLLVAKFVRELKRLDGMSLRLQDPDILLTISRYARTSRHSSLKVIYQDIQREIANEISQLTKS